MIGLEFTLPGGSQTKLHVLYLRLLPYEDIFPGLDMYGTHPAQRPEAAGKDLSDLSVHNVSDLSVDDLFMDDLAVEYLSVGDLSVLTCAKYLLSSKGLR